VEEAKILNTIHFCETLQHHQNYPQVQRVQLWEGSKPAYTDYSISTRNLLALIEELEHGMYREELKIQQLKELVQTRANRVNRAYSQAIPSNLDRTMNEEKKVENSSRVGSIVGGRSKSLPDLYFKSMIQEQELIEAAQEGDYSALQKILNEPGVDVNVQDESGMSATHWCARTGQKECTKLLLNCRGININQGDSLGWTPLHYAAHGGFESIVTILLQSRSIDVTKKNNQKQTAQDLAANKSIRELLRYAKKKQQMVKDQYGSIRLTTSPMFGQDPQLSTSSIEKALQEQNMTLRKLKGEVLKMQESNSALEKELFKQREGSPVLVESIEIAEDFFF